MRRFAKPLYGLTPVPRVRIPPSPPDVLTPAVIIVYLTLSLPERLGVTRAGLYKYLNQENVPSLDILERAKALGIEVKYGDLDPDLIRARAKKDTASPEAQMLLPLAIQGLTDQNITVEVGPREPNAIALNVTIKFSQLARS
jgi:hypothetical protein